MGSKAHANPTTAALLCLLAACAGAAPAVVTVPPPPALPPAPAPLLEARRASLDNIPAPAPALARAPGAAVQVTMGQPLRLENHDTVCHAWFAPAPHVGDLGTLRPGEATTVVFERPGTVRLYCSLHPGERITVHVTPAP